MNVKSSSWHAKVYRFVKDRDAQDNPTVCSYWGTAIGFPLFLLMLSPVLLVCFPMIWLIDVIEKKVTWKPKCPFGTVDFKN